ncbi:hypothetical protein CYMTET_42015 [Cymbomonas tetramitiformis]|uniref:Uncharacterized protein n=1 Tax=Cymbomonas tetramitiformis TaxID=36881 RepID=A0AAE0C6W1_9CHLO|nr:hypothetical protein CYMTET_42015 [Cymbomonas tetramitiformis]
MDEGEDGVDEGDRVYAEMDIQCGQGELAFSDDDSGLLVLWNYSDILLNSFLTLVQVHSWHDHPKKHLVKALPSHRLPNQPPEETMDFEEENYRIARLVPEVPEAAAAVTPPAQATILAILAATKSGGPVHHRRPQAKATILATLATATTKSSSSSHNTSTSTTTSGCFGQDAQRGAGGICGNSESTTSLSETAKSMVEDVSTPDHRKPGVG